MGKLLTGMVLVLFCAGCGSDATASTEASTGLGSACAVEVDAGEPAIDGCTDLRATLVQAFGPAYEDKHPNVCYADSVEFPEQTVCTFRCNYGVDGTWDTVPEAEQLCMELGGECGSQPGTQGKARYCWLPQ